MMKSKLISFGLFGLLSASFFLGLKTLAKEELIKEIITNKELIIIFYCG